MDGVSLTPKQLLANSLMFELPRAERLIIGKCIVDPSLGIHQPTPNALLSQGGTHQTVVIRHDSTLEE